MELDPYNRRIRTNVSNHIIGPYKDVSKHLPLLAAGVPLSAQ